MRMLVLYNEPILPAAHAEADSEQEILFTVESICENLSRAGFDVDCLALDQDLSILNEELSRRRPGAVFNLFEGLANDPATEAIVAQLLEKRGVPFTGSSSRSLYLSRNKILTKQTLSSARLPTPDYFAAVSLPVPVCPIPWPVIVKPALQDASIGIGQSSVVTHQAALEERVAQILRTYGAPVLVEKFIPGREFSVALIECSELTTLPASEIRFEKAGPGYWPIVSYEAKWRPGSPEYDATPPSYPAVIVPLLAERLRELARRAFYLLRCRDYARVDFRVDPEGAAYILEVNPNPDLSPAACLAGALHSAGIHHETFTIELARTALARGVQAVDDR